MNEDFCEVCQSPLMIIHGNYGPHYGKIMCQKCGFKGWARNPESPKIGTTAEQRIGKRSVMDVCNFHNFTEEFCFCCLRKKEELGICETLTVDHIKELSLAKKGENLDVITNMQVLCSACHKMKNWLRLYLNWHINKKRENGDTNS